MALKVVALIRAEAGREQQVGEALRTLTSASQGDRGCTSYELYTSAGEPTTFVTVEEWESQEDLDAHLQAPHLQEAFSAVGELLASAPEIHLLTAV
jgi:quinol monooxygenase YgiN